MLFKRAVKLQQGRPKFYKYIIRALLGKKEKDINCRGRRPRRPSDLRNFDRLKDNIFLNQTWSVNKIQKSGCINKKESI